VNTTFNIRLAKKEDTAAILAIYAHYVEHTAVSFEETVPSEAEFQQRILAVLQQAPWLVFEVDNTIVAYAYSSGHRGRPAYRYTRELSVYVNEEFQGKGIAAALYTTLLALLKAQGYANTVIGIALPNDRSIQFHEKMGYRQVGIYHNIGFKHGAYRDVGWWEMAIRDTAPDTVRMISQLSAEEWQNAIMLGLNKLH